MITKNSIGLIEMGSIASGIQAADIMLKTSEVELMISRTICSGKYMTLIAGDVAAVTTAIDRAVNMVGFGVIDSFVIPNVHPEIFPAIAGHNNIQMLESLGIVEAYSVASLIEAADASAKASKVQLVELRLAMALGGKAFFSVTGDVAAVTSAVEAGARVVLEKGLLVNKVIIANPRQELLSEMI